MERSTIPSRIDPQLVGLNRLDVELGAVRRQQCRWHSRYFHMLTSCIFATSPDVALAGWLGRLDEVGPVYAPQRGLGCEQRTLFYALRPANRPRFSQPVALQLDLWKYWTAIKTPTLVLRGVGSDLLPPDLARDIIRCNSWARVLEIEGCGHAPPLTSHEQIERVCEFLQA